MVLSLHQQPTCASPQKTLKLVFIINFHDFHSFSENDQQPMLPAQEQCRIVRAVDVRACTTTHTRTLTHSLCGYCAKWSNANANRHFALQSLCFVIARFCKLVATDWPVKCCWCWSVVSAAAWFGADSPLCTCVSVWPVWREGLLCLPLLAIFPSTDL